MLLFVLKNKDKKGKKLSIALARLEEPDSGPKNLNKRITSSGPLFKRRLCHRSMRRCEHSICFEMGSSARIISNARRKARHHWAQRNLIEIKSLIKRYLKQFVAQISQLTPCCTGRPPTGQSSIHQRCVRVERRHFSLRFIHLAHGARRARLPSSSVRTIFTKIAISVQLISLSTG